MGAIILIIAAIIPPIVLMFLIYQKDKVEREPVGLIVKTVIFGMISVIPIMIVEILFEAIFGHIIDLEHTVFGAFFDAFICVALIEEFFKMMACKLSVWKNREFNYTFDGIVYCVASAVGFALVENVLYVLQNGFGNAIVRAITAVPGHVTDGIFMGIYLGIAKYHHVRGDKKNARLYGFLALLVPVILHGIYDFLLMAGVAIFILLFFVGLIVLDVVTIILVNKNQHMDRKIYPDPVPAPSMMDGVMPGNGYGMPTTPNYGDPQGNSQNDNFNF